MYVPWYTEHICKGTSKHFENEEIKRVGRFLVIAK